MNRREFLQTFGIALVGVSLRGAVVNDEPLLEHDGGPVGEYESSPPRPYEGIPYVIDFHAVGNAMEPKPGIAGMTRSSGRDLFGFPTGSHIFCSPMNACGGLLRFVPYCGEAIYVTDDYPVAVRSTIPEIKAFGLIRLPGLCNFKVLES